MRQDRLWALSLIVIGVLAAILVGLPAVGVSLPDIVTRILGVLLLVAVPVLAFTTVRKFGKK